MPCLFAQAPEGAPAAEALPFTLSPPRRSLREGEPVSVSAISFQLDREVATELPSRETRLATDILDARGPPLLPPWGGTGDALTCV